MSRGTKKILVFGVIFLFICISFTSVTNAGINNFYKEKICKIEINEYKQDGSIGKNIVELTKTEIIELKSDILNSKTNEQRFEIFKDKGLIPIDINFGDLEQGMYKRAEQLGISKEIDQDRIKIRLPILLTLFTHNFAIYFGGISVGIGLSPIMRLFNLPGIDIADFIGGFFS